MSQIPANNPALRSWIEVSSDSDFPIQNLPFGVVRSENLTPHVASRIGNKVIDLKTLHVLGYLENLPFELADFDTDSLNPMMKKGKKAVRDLRNRLSKLFDVNQPDLQQNEQHVEQVLIPVENVKMCMVIVINCR